MKRGPFLSSQRTYFSVDENAPDDLASEQDARKEKPYKMTPMNLKNNRMQIKAT